MDIERIRKSAEEYVNKVIQIVQEPASNERVISEEGRRKMIDATMRVAGFGATKTGYTQKLSR
jgi:hypothetical protein